METQPGSLFLALWRLDSTDHNAILDVLLLAQASSGQLNRALRLKSHTYLNNQFFLSSFDIAGPSFVKDSSKKWYHLGHERTPVNVKQLAYVSHFIIVHNSIIFPFMVIKMTQSMSNVDCSLERRLCKRQGYGPLFARSSLHPLPESIYMSFTYLLCDRIVSYGFRTVLPHLRWRAM